MKRINKSLYIAAGLYVIAACGQVEQVIPEKPVFPQNELVEKVVFEVLPIKDGDSMNTKASAVPNGSIVNFVWEASDTVGIYPDKGSQVYFNIEDGVGTSSVSFDGGGWALKQNSSYVSYYPFVGDIYLKRDKIPVSFTGQKQTGMVSPFSGTRYYLATEASTSTNGVLTFTYNTLNTIINVNATLPAGTYTKMSLNLSEPLFVEEGTYSLDDRKIVGTKYTKTLEIELEDFTLTEQGTVPVYIMSAPVDLRGKEVVVRFTKSDGTRYKCTKSVSREYLANTRYGLTCDQMKKEAEIINFADAEVKRLCVENWDTDGDGELDMDEAAAVTDLGKVFYNNKEIVSFDELQYFTGLTSIGGLTSSLPDAYYHGFAYSSNLVSVILPETITIIGYTAFEGCSSLTDISFPSSLQRIDSYAFSGCTSFKSVSFPSQQIEIDILAFWNGGYRIQLNNISSVKLNGPTHFSNHIATGLVFVPSENYSLLLGKNCTSITFFDDGEFNTSVFNCHYYYGNDYTHINSITVEEGNPKYDSRDGCNALIETATNSLILGCESTVIPESITAIGAGAFAYLNCPSPFSITIPASVTYIGSDAFAPEWYTYTEEGTLRNSYSIIFLATEPPTLELAPYGDYNNFGHSGEAYPYLYIYVPAGSVDAYKSAPGWSEYADRIFSMEGGTVPGSGDGGDD